MKRRIHLDLGQQFLSPSGTKNGHAAFNVPNVKPVARQQQAAPDGFVRLVLRDAEADTNPLCRNWVGSRIYDCGVERMIRTPLISELLILKG